MTIMDSARQDHDIVVKITKDYKDLDVSLPKLKKLVAHICKGFDLNSAVVGIAIVDDAESRRLNKQFLNRNRPTDCLSFDLSEDDRSKSFELAVNGQRAREQARLRGHDPEAELALYVTHALLHNLGFDDSTPEKAKKMHETEDEILQNLGFGFVYNTDDDKDSGANAAPMTD